MSYDQVIEKLYQVRGIVSTQMIIDVLRNSKYQIIHEALIDTRAISSALAVNDAISASLSEESGSERSETTIIHLLDLGSFDYKEQGIPLPAIALGTSEESASLLKHASPKLLGQLTIIASPDKTDRAQAMMTLHNLVSSFLITVREFANTCEQIARNSDSFQKIVDVASDYFGYFINITDSHGVLLAYTKSIEPQDSINSELVKNGYIVDDKSTNPLNNGYLPGRIQGKTGVQAFTAYDDSGQALVSYVLHLHGQYFGHIAMECPEKQLTQGLIDAFAIFVSFCERIASTIHRLTFTPDFGTHNLLRTLVAERHLDPSFLYDQAKKVPIPTQAYFILLSFSVEFDFRDQLEMFAQEIDNFTSIGHQIFVHNASIYVLIYSDLYQTVAEEFNRFFDFTFRYASHTMYTSDIFRELSDAYLAAREIDAIQKYRAFITHVRNQTNSKKPENVFVFLDAFCFYWSDPLADNEIRSFSIERTLINTIARDDRLNNTDHLALLSAYLLNNCKAAAIADAFHMHRNGIQYRIDKITNTYDIDLDDFITRQYLQTSLRVQLVASGEFVLDDQ